MVDRTVAVLFVGAALACSADGPPGLTDGAAPEGAVADATGPDGSVPDGALADGAEPEAECSGTPSEPVTHAYATEAGVPGDLLSLDFYAPQVDETCGPRPLVVWVHGGGWLMGSKTGGNIEGKAALFAAQGAALASVNYRLSPDPPETDNPDRVTHPIHAQDVARAVAWLIEQASSLGIDPSRIALLGHSAGAHLVALVGSDERFLAAHALGLSAIRCVGSYDTRYDMVQAIQQASGDRLTMLTNAFTDDPAVWEDASPSAHVAAGSVVPLYQTARRGALPRRTDHDAFVGLLEEAGATVMAIDAAGLSHEEVNRTIGEPGDTVMTPAVTELLRACFQSGG